MKLTAEAVTAEARERYGPFHGIVDEITGIRLVLANRYLDQGPGWENAALTEFQKALDEWERDRDDVPAGALRELQVRLTLTGLTSLGDQREIPA